MKGKNRWAMRCTRSFASCYFGDRVMNTHYLTCFSRYSWTSLREVINASPWMPIMFSGRMIAWCFILSKQKVISWKTSQVICGLCTWTSVLALAKFLLSHLELLNGNFPLFLGNNQYERFIKRYQRVIHENKETFHILGVEEHLLGSN